MRLPPQTDLRLLSVLAFSAAACAAPTGTPAPTPAPEAQPSGEGPIIDVHVHGDPPSNYGPPGNHFCMEMLAHLKPWDPGKQGPWPKVSHEWFRNPGCANPIPASVDADALMRETLAVMERLDIRGVLSAPPEVTARWHAAAPERVIRGRHFAVGGKTSPSPADLAAEIEAGELEVFAEVVNQYAGVAPNGPEMEPYWALAEKHDIPVGIHIGTMPPGIAHLIPSARVAISDPLLLEEVLLRYPALRVYVMHAGMPMFERTIALMQAYPNVYAGTGVLQAVMTREGYYDFLRRMFEAGLGKRIMFGSDQMTWPGMIEPSVALVREAPFLTHEQKRDILYNNAARFLRLD